MWCRMNIRNWTSIIRMRLTWIHHTIRKTWHTRKISRTILLWSTCRSKWIRTIRRCHRISSSRKRIAKGVRHRTRHRSRHRIRSRTRHHTIRSWRKRIPSPSWRRKSSWKHISITTSRIRTIIGSIHHL